MAFEHIILHYGIGIVFLLVFLQEVGIPSPIPNELMLLYAGYLSSVGEMNYAWLFVVAVAGDFIGTSILYRIFYSFGGWISGKYPKLMPIAKIESWRQRLSKRDGWEIYLGRLLPYARAYVSVAAGSLGIKPSLFEPMVLLSAITWSGGYVILGHLLGAGWANFASKLKALDLSIFILIIIFVLVLVLPRLYHRFSRKHH